MKRIVPLILAAALLGGCGGSGTSDKDAVQQVVEDYYAAAGTGDGKTACALLTDDARIGSMNLCVRTVETNFDSSELDLGIGNAKFKRRLKVSNVTVNGDQAYAAMSPKGEVRLKKVDGDWKIDWDPFYI